MTATTSQEGRTSADELLAEKQGATLWVTLNRPEAFNALTPAMVSALSAALDTVDSDPSIRALVIGANGPAFCSGADLKAVLAASAGANPAHALKRFLEHAGIVFSRLERVHVPTIAAVNGLALAGGTEILLCCDFVVADEQARIGEGHAKYGQLPGGGGSARLPRRVGAAGAKYLMFSGELCTAAQAQHWGLVDEVAPSGQLRSRVEAALAKFADKSPLVLARMKYLVHESLEQPLDVSLRGEILMGELHVHSFDRNEGLAAFAEKRKPEFRGQ